MNENLKNFLKALDLIEKSDYKTNRVILREEIENIYGDEFSTYENNFVAKLNEKYAILNHTKEIKQSIDLKRELQIPKKFAYSEFDDIEIRRSFDKLNREFAESNDGTEEYSLIPDFFIHKSENDRSPENQKLIAEIKTEQNLSFKKFAWDFFKLIIYLNKANFQTAVFLSVNITNEKIIGYLKKYISDYYYLPLDYKRLFIVIKENYESENVVCSFQEFFDRNYR